jgi:hypothetical protein
MASDVLVAPQRVQVSRPLRRSATGLLEIVVYDKCCRIGGSLRLDDLADSEIGDWTMPAYRAACRYAAAQGWLVIADDRLTLTIAGLRAA